MEASSMSGKRIPGTPGNTPGQLAGAMLSNNPINKIIISKVTNTPLNKLNTLNGNLSAGNTVGSTTPTTPLGANKAATNRAMGMQSKGGKTAQKAVSGNVGVVSQGMVNAEIQNDDVLDPTKLMGM